MKYLNLDFVVPDGPYRTYRKLIWLYLILLIFEGALRKWFLPSLATPLLIIRDPIAIWLTFAGIKHGWLRTPSVIVMWVASTLSFLLTLVVGHQNLTVALFGWRIYFFYFPVMFVMGKVMTREDLLKMGRFVLYLSIPMTLLILIQFNSPSSAWVNVGLGGEGTAGFAGALDYMRPSGTFSFTSGYVMFQAVVGCLLLYYLIMNKTLLGVHRIPNWLLMIMIGCYMLAIPTSISRTNFFQTIVFLGFLGFAAIRKRTMKAKFLKFTLIIVLVIVVMMILHIGSTSMQAFTERFKTANEVEGGVRGTLGDRYLGGLLSALSASNIPFFGYGIGLGTNVGAKLMGGNMYSFGFNAEVEWGRIIGECGMLLGLAIIAVRVFFSLNLLVKAYRCLKRHFDLLPWMLSAGMMLTVPQGQWGIPTNLGFCILFGGLTLAAVNTSENC